MTFARPAPKTRQVTKRGNHRADSGAAERYISRSRGEPLQAELAADLGARLGQRTDGMVLHRDAAAAAASTAINAQAFSVGEHIFLGAGTHDLHSDAGRRMLTHEATHVLQHQRGDIRGGEMISSRGETLENEAEQAARSVDQHPVGASGGAGPGGKLRARTSGFVNLNSGLRMMRLICPEMSKDYETKKNQEKLDFIKDSLSVMGFKHDNRKYVGKDDYTDVVDWEPAEVKKALAEICKYSKKGTRLFTVWYLTQDDLRYYPNILTYMRRLNLLSKESMGIDSYTEAAGKMKEAYFAGQNIKVHPKAFYFLASAQLAMDMKADSQAIRDDEGSGHYIPMGSFRTMVGNIHKDLLLILAGMNNGSTAIPGSAKAYSAVLGELAYMCTAIKAQVTKDQVLGQGAHLHGEHRDPTMVQYLSGPREKAIAAMIPTMDDDVARVEAEKLLIALSLTGEIEGAKFSIPDTQHSTWAVDPHGTDHAMGMAIDIFKGLGSDKHEEGKRWSSGAFTNAGFGEQLEAYKLLIAKYGHETSKYDHAQGYAPIPPSLKLVAFTSLSHEQARSLDRLAIEHMDEVMQIINGEDRNLKTPFAVRIEKGEIIQLTGPLSDKDRAWIYNKRNKAMRDYGSLQSSAYLGFSVRASALAQAGAGAGPRIMGENLTNMVSMEQAELANAAAGAKLMSPQVLTTTLDKHAIELEQIVKSAELREPVAEQAAEASDADARVAIESREDNWAETDAERLEYLEIKRKWAAAQDHLAEKEQAKQEQLESLSGKDKRERKKQLDAEISMWKLESDGYSDTKKSWNAFITKHKNVHGKAKSFDDERKGQGKRYGNETKAIDKTFATLRGVGPTMGTRNLIEISDKIGGMFEFAVWAHAHMQKDRASKVGKKTSWSQSIGNDERGLYDQSTVMVRAIESVKSYEPTNEKPANQTPANETNLSSLKSGHHWKIGPTWDPEIAKQRDNDPKTWNLLTSDSDYKAALVQDMTQRLGNSGSGKNQLERIMEIMAETPGGRAVVDPVNHPLTGFEKAAEGYRAAMLTVLEDDTAAFNAMLTRVRKRIIEPYQGRALPAEELKLKSNLRGRGYYI